MRPWTWAWILVLPAVAAILCVTVPDFHLFPKNNSSTTPTPPATPNAEVGRNPAREESKPAAAHAEDKSPVRPENSTSAAATLPATATTATVLVQKPLPEPVEDKFLDMAAPGPTRGERWKPPSPPENGAPFPGHGRTVPYEDVLDHCDLVLVGRVLKWEPVRPAQGLEQPEVLGRVQIEVAKVLRGEYTNKTEEIAFGESNIPGLDDPKKLHVLLCLRRSGGKLRLAGDPVEGGGYVPEGPDLIAKIIEAAKDPARGYQSKDFAVKLSSALRLARAWLAAPPKDRPAPPADLMDTFLAGLWSYQRGQGLNVDAAAWEGINALLDCRIHSIWEYPVAMKKGRRSKLAEDVTGAWERTKAAVRERRVERNTLASADEKTRAEVAALIVKLGSEKYPERQAAQEALLKIGKPALKQVREGARSADPQIVSGCRLLVLLISAVRDYRPDTQSHVFDLDRAEPFISDADPKPAAEAER